MLKATFSPQLIQDDAPDQSIASVEPFPGGAARRDLVRALQLIDQAQEILDEMAHLRQSECGGESEQVYEVFDLVDTAFARTLELLGLESVPKVEAAVA